MPALDNGKLVASAPPEDVQGLQGSFRARVPVPIVLAVPFMHFLLFLLV